MTFGTVVRIKVDEPEYCNKHGKVGIVVSEDNGTISVRFEDAQVLYFRRGELEVII